MRPSLKCPSCLRNHPCMVRPKTILLSTPWRPAPVYPIMRMLPRGSKCQTRAETSERESITKRDHLPPQKPQHTQGERYTPLRSLPPFAFSGSIPKHPAIVQSPPFFSTTNRKDGDSWSNKKRWLLCHPAEQAVEQIE